MKDKHHSLKNVWIFYLLITLIFIWPYSESNAALPNAWRFALATVALMAVTGMFFKKEWTAVLGFPKSLKQVIACGLAGMAAFLVFYFFIDFVLSYGGYQKQPFADDKIFESFGSYPLLARTLWGIFQPLNEEIVLRALLLGFFARFFRHRAYLAILAALEFSLLHFLMYFYGTLGEQLDVLTLLTLFFFGLAANALYLTFNHIGFGLVIHVAWNWWRFSGAIAKDGVILNEAQTFNILEGSTQVFMFVAALSLVCIAGLMVHEKRLKRC